MIKVGDRIVVGTWDIPVFVERIYFEDNDGNEVFEFESARQMLALKWGVNGEHGKSKVALYDEGNVWHKYLELN